MYLFHVGYGYEKNKTALISYFTKVIFVAIKRLDILVRWRVKNLKVFIAMNLSKLACSLFLWQYFEILDLKFSNIEIQSISVGIKEERILVNQTHSSHIQAVSTSKIKDIFVQSCACVEALYVELLCHIISMRQYQSIVLPRDEFNGNGLMA